MVVAGTRSQFNASKMRQQDHKNIRVGQFPSVNHFTPKNPELLRLHQQDLGALSVTVIGKKGKHHHK